MATNEVFTLTYKSSLADFEQCVLWMKRNLESKHRVTIMIRKPAEVPETSIKNFFTVQEKVVQLQERPPSIKEIPVEETIKLLTPAEQLQEIIKSSKQLIDQQKPKDGLAVLKQIEELKLDLDVVSRCEIELQTGLAYFAMLERDQALIHWSTYISLYQGLQREKDQPERQDQFKVDTVMVLNSMAQIHQDKRNLDQAIEIFTQLIDQIDEMTLVKQDKELQMVQVNAYNSLGFIYHTKKDLNTAIQYFNLSIEEAKQVYGPQHISIANKLHNLGETYRMNKQPDKALKVFLQSLEIKRVEYEKAHKSKASTMYLIGMCLVSLKKSDDALHYCVDALHDYQSPEVVLTMPENENNIQIGTVAHSIGELYLQSKKQSESLVHFELAYRSRLKALGIKHKDTLRSGNFYGQTLYQNKQNDESLAILKQVIEAHEQMFGPTDKQLVEMYQSLATVQMAKGDTQNAALSLQKSKDIASKQADPAVQSQVMSKIDGLKGKLGL